MLQTMKTHQFLWDEEEEKEEKNEEEEEEKERMYLSMKFFPRSTHSQLN